MLFLLSSASLGLLAEGANTNPVVKVTAVGLSGSDPVVILGNDVQFIHAVTGAANVVTWRVNGAGTINSNGVYTPPSSMPTSDAVTIVAALASDPAITGTYHITLNSPVPSITSNAPTQAVAGATIQIEFWGNNFVPGVTILANNVAVPTTFVSAHRLTAQISAPAGSTSNISVVAHNPSPMAGNPASFTVGAAALQLFVWNPSGSANNGQAPLGVPLTLTTSDNSDYYNLRLWALQGAGELTESGDLWQSGVYTPPVTMPASATVSITTHIENYPLLTTTKTLNLVNPVPKVTSFSPTELLTDGTQTVTLNGSGFVPGTTVLFNGNTLPITYVSYTQATVRVPVSAAASGTLDLQVHNPSPGGGAGSSFAEPIVPNSIALTARDPDGTNKVTAELGVQVIMTAAVTGSEQTAVAWSLTGAGSISTSGVYTAPASLPADQAVTIRAKLVSNPAITASYSLNIVNPVPEIADIDPITIPSGATTQVSLAGTGFIPHTVIWVNGAAVPTTYQSATAVTASIPVAANATGNLTVQAKNPTPGGGTGDEYMQAISAPVSITAAARILDQTTFGPHTSLIQHVQQEGITAWLAEQFDTPPAVFPIVSSSVHPSYCIAGEMCVESEWWRDMLTGDDQLRQRVAFALSEIFVISQDTVDAAGIVHNANMLAADAFTNWYTIMNDVTLSPGMGEYLDMVNNAAPQPGQIANENFARENMQLFNLGLVLLNQDGTPQTANGNQIPTYTQAQVQAFARAFTGWTYANAAGAFYALPNYSAPMIPVAAKHDESAKTLLNDEDPASPNGKVLPAGQTAQADLTGALTNIFNHPNLPPFVCEQLIQHLVKSNPSPDYISRVAAVFINDGNGVRGDMRGVLTAIFTDPEARSGDSSPSPSDGHLREPILWTAAVMRGLGYVNIDPNNYYDVVSQVTAALNEKVFDSPSVFNFFPPDYVIPQTSLNAPEFGIENTASVADRLTLADILVNNDLNGFNVDLSATSPLGQIVTSQGSAALVQALNNIFLDGYPHPQLSAEIADETRTLSDPAQKVRIAAYLTITSSEYKVLH